jgi:hypothetical protein
MKTQNDYLKNYLFDIIFCDGGDDEINNVNDIFILFTEKEKENFKTLNENEKFLLYLKKKKEYLKQNKN